MSTHSTSLTVEQRQLTLMALAYLAVAHPGWQDALGEIALLLDNDVDKMRDLFNKFQELRKADLQLRTDFLLERIDCLERGLQASVEQAHSLSDLLESSQADRARLMTQQENQEFARLAFDYQKLLEAAEGVLAHHERSWQKVLADLPEQSRGKLADYAVPEWTELKEALVICRS